MNDNGEDRARAPWVEQTGNPYFDALTGSIPPELLRFEQAMYPYNNDLPGVSSVNAARTLSGAILAWGKGSRRAIMISSIVLVILGIGLVASLSTVLGL
ncbi:MAG: hypothetical protein ACRDFS_08775 [Chloroflexota bacterium]